MSRKGSFEQFDPTALRARFAEMAKNAEPVKPPECGACDDTHFVHTNDRGIRRFSPCIACRSRSVLGMPQPLQGVTFSKVQRTTGNATAIQRAKAFLSGTRDLFLTGPVGTGKTYLAAAVVNEFAKTTNKTPVFARWPMTLHTLQPGNSTVDERREIERRLFEAPLLVIDDIGAERDEASDFTRRMAFLMYEARGDAALLTVITSNLGLAELAAHQGDDRLTSRIAGRADVVIVSGVDLRVQKLRAV